MIKFSRRALTRQVNRLLIIPLLGIILWSIGIGWGITHALETTPKLAQSTNAVGTRFQAGQELYLSSCSGCHIAIPPEVLPTNTWQELIENPNKHYGTSVPNLIRLSQLLIWDYLRAYSRVLPTNEPTPFYVEQSRYFKALHPRVEFTEPVTHKSCIVCHPGVAKFNYRTLSPEWKDAP